MRGLTAHVLLTLVWMTARGEVSAAGFAVGIVIGYLILFLGRGFFGTTRYVLRVPRVIAFALYFGWKLVQASLRVAYDVVTPAHHMRPGVIAVPLDARTDEEITLLANIVSLTPGTLSLDVSEDRRLLYVHALYFRHPDDVRREVKDGFERRLLEVLR